MLDLDISYDKVDRKNLIREMKEWLETHLKETVCAMITLTRVRTKGDPTDAIAILRRGVPQGAPTSPVLCNMHKDRLLNCAVETNFVRSSEGAIFMLTNCVLLKAKRQPQLEQWFRAATRGQTDGTRSGQWRSAILSRYST